LNIGEPSQFGCIILKKKNDDVQMMPKHALISKKIKALVCPEKGGLVSPK
jgi:hypothetical protein